MLSNPSENMTSAELHDAGYSAGRFGTRPLDLTAIDEWSKAHYLRGLHAGAVDAYDDDGNDLGTYYRISAAPDAHTVHRGPHYVGTFPTKADAQRAARDDHFTERRRAHVKMAAEMMASDEVDIREQLHVSL